MKKQDIDCTADPECQALLNDLTALAIRAKALSQRLDRERTCVGTCWGITRGLDMALQDAQREFLSVEELPDDCLPPQKLLDQLLRGPKVGDDGRIIGGVYNGMTPAEVRADRDAYNRACGE